MYECRVDVDMLNAIKSLLATYSPVYRGTFMISSKKENLVWIFDFVGQKEADCFQRPFPSEKYNRAIKSLFSKNNGCKHRGVWPIFLNSFLKLEHVS